MIVFAAGDYYKKVASAVCGSDTKCTLGECRVLRYLSGEMYAQITGDIKGEDCVICGSVAPPDEQMLAVLSLASAAKRSGAKRVTALLPYLGYSRQDKNTAKQSGGIELVGRLLQSAGVGRVITVDEHSLLDKQLIGLPLISLNPMRIFVPPVKKLGWKNPTIVAPDKGAINRALELANALNVTGMVRQFDKKRIGGMVNIGLIGEVGANVVLVDDILDTGQTLVSACEVLREKHVKKIAVVVTHGVFSGAGWQKLFELGVQRLFVSDSYSRATELDDPRITVVPTKSIWSKQMWEAGS